MTEKFSAARKAVKLFQEDDTCVMTEKLSITRKGRIHTYGPCAWVMQPQKAEEYPAVKKITYGEGVRWLQWELCEAGYPVSVDGIFGTETKAALQKFQISCELCPDGIANLKNRKKYLYLPEVSCIITRLSDNPKYRRNYTYYEKVEDYVRSIPDFPEPGIIFRDITTVLQDPDGLKLAIDGLKERLDGVDFDVVVGAESRGFIFGAPLAYEFGKGFVPVRKKGNCRVRQFLQNMILSTVQQRSRCIKIPSNRVRKWL